MRCIGDKGGRGKGNEEVATCLEQRSQRADHQNVDAHDAHAQQAIDQRAIDDDINVKEARAQDGNTDRERDKEKYKRLYSDLSMGSQGSRRRRKLCKAQQISIT